MQVAGFSISSNKRMMSSKLDVQDWCRFTLSRSVIAWVELKAIWQSAPWNLMDMFNGLDDKINAFYAVFDDFMPLHFFLPF